LDAKETAIVRLAFEQYANASGAVPKKAACQLIFGLFPRGLQTSLYKAIDGGTHSIGLKELVGAVVVITRGTPKERTRFVFQVYDQFRNGAISKADMDQLLVVSDDTKTVAAAFRDREQMDIEQFGEWVRLNPQATALIEWIFHPPVEHFSKSLIPSFHESVAKESNFSGAEVIQLEKRYWSLINSRRGVGVAYGAQPKFDAVFLQGLTCSLLPDCVISRFVYLWDTNRDGQVDFRELITGLSSIVRGTPQKQLDFYFQVFNTNDSGFLDVSEMRQMAAVMVDLGRSEKSATLQQRERARLVKQKSRVRTLSSMDEFGEVAEPSTEALPIELPAGDAPFSLELDDEAEKVFKGMLPFVSRKGSENEGLVMVDLVKFYECEAGSLLQTLINRVVQLGYLLFGIRPANGKGEKAVFQLQKLLDDAQSAVALEGMSRTCYLVSAGWWSEWNSYASGKPMVLPPGATKRMKKEHRRTSSGGAANQGGRGSPRPSAFVPQPPGPVKNQPLLKATGIVERITGFTGFGGHSTWGNRLRTVRGFRQEFTLEDAIGSHACSLEARMRVNNGIPLGCSLLLPVHTVNCVQTLKAKHLNVAKIT
jgi:Ca2+-binding EF-hand superfamily protein